ncbi:MAG: hypothetical protein EA426_10555 [Spirochaetaceae bacterium]|nr:MAG: hypothetical protein EA426_10555 [Spirochaetaceae bacterium]
MRNRFAHRGEIVMMMKERDREFFLNSAIQRVALIASSLVLVMLVTACATGAQSRDSRVPEWYIDRASVYPDSAYLTANGSGESRRAAENDAAGSLSRIFASNIRVESFAEQRYREIVGTSAAYSENERTAVQAVAIESQQQLRNIRFSDPFTDEFGRVHILAYLHRQQTAAIYRGLIDTNVREIERLVGRAAAASTTVRRYAYLSAADIVRLNNEVYIDQLRIVSPAAAGLGSFGISSERLANLINDAAEQMVFSVHVFGDDSGRVDAAIRRQISLRNFTVSDTGVLRVIGSVTIKPVEINPRYRSVRWVLEIDLIDERGEVLVTAAHDGRENAITHSEAVNFAYREIEDTIRDRFVHEMFRFFDSIAFR